MKRKSDVVKFETWLQIIDTNHFHKQLKKAYGSYYQKGYSHKGSLGYAICDIIRKYPKLCYLKSSYGGDIITKTRKSPPPDAFQEIKGNMKWFVAFPLDIIDGMTWLEESYEEYVTISKKKKMHVTFQFDVNDMDIFMEYSEIPSTLERIRRTITNPNHLHPCYGCYENPRLDYVEV